MLSFGDWRSGLAVDIYPRKRYIVIHTFVILGLMLAGNANAGTFVLNWQANFSNPLDSKTLDWNIYNNAQVGSEQDTCFMGKNISLSNSILYLTLDTSSNGCHDRYSGAGLDTYYYHAQTYGMWQVVAQFPAGYGTSGYFGLFAENNTWPPEIDFGEAIARQPVYMFFTEHYGSSSAPSAQSVPYTNGVNYTSGFHTYTLQWVPGTLSYFIDSVLVLTQPQMFTPPSSGMKFAIGILAGDCGTWVDCPTNAAANGFPNPVPSTFAIKSIQIYTYDQ